MFACWRPRLSPIVPGLANRLDSRSDPDPTPQACTTSLAVDEAGQLLEEFRDLASIEGDLNLRMSAALMVVQNAAMWSDEASKLADYLDSL